MSTTFWSTNPIILFDKNYIFQLWPTANLSYSEKLNAITRLVILLSVLGYIFTMNLNFIITGIITIVIIYILYKTQEKQEKQKFTKEGFFGLDDFQEQSQIKLGPITLPPFLKSEFIKTTKTNPLGNVLLTDYTDNPTRSSAPPSFNTEVYENINNATKKMVQSINSGIKDTNKQLYGDLGEKFEFDQSQWSFYSNPNTKIPNDQGAFADYLYGNMPSAKEGDAFALVQDNMRYNLY